MKKEKAVNKELAKMLKKISDAKKKSEATVVVLTTSRNHYKKTLSNDMGFGSSDLKPSFHEAYIYLLTKFNLIDRPINLSEYVIEWVVKLK